ncbi:hypothetical protein [Eremococcus coleocola]|uniref:hypothetical protein n=1 Tax=Eremococcus coleocola TaxID=88132 RepID=UPI0003FB273F|nr:hypothetical protein [Eremococcus coleocola]
MNIEKLIHYIVLSEPEVREHISQVDGIYNVGANRTTNGVYPLFEYHEIGGTDTMYADDSPEFERYTFQVSYISANEEYRFLRAKIKSAFRKAGFIINSEYTVKNAYTNLFHYSIHIKIELDDSLFKHMLDKYETIYNEIQPVGKDEKLPTGFYYDESSNSEYEIVDETENMEFIEYDINSTE